MTQALAPRLAEGSARVPRAPRADPVPARGPARALLQMQRHLGNRAVGALLQTKLRIGAPNDRYEREADQVADLVARSDAPVPAPQGAEGGAPALQRCACGGSCASCAAHDDERAGLVVQTAAISAAPPGCLQRESTESCAVTEEPMEEDEKETEIDEEEQAGEAGAKPVGLKRRGPDEPVPPEDVEARIDASRGRGVPLPHATRELMESRFGYDFSGVRVHTGPSAHHLNRDLNSLAFATGTDLYFGPGQFQPGTSAGRHLIAHELTHVVQQAGGGGVVREKAAAGTVARKDDERHGGSQKYGHVLPGVAVHEKLEEILRAADAKKDLVTEAAIAGANRKGAALNKIGVADLYKSEPAFTVTGVRGLRGVAEESDIIAMDNPGSMGTKPGVSSWPTLAATTKGGPRVWAGNFPSTIRLGEIKPLSVEMLGAAWRQLDFYEQGYAEFVKRIHTVSGKATRPSLTIGPRLKLDLPSYLDFDNWAAEHAKDAKPATFPTTPIGPRRVWVADLGNGIYAYFHLAKGLTGPPPAWQTDQIRQLREIKKGITDAKHPRGDKLVGGRFLPGGPRVAAPHVGAPRRSLSGTPTRYVQRATKDRPANYWSDRGRAWEKGRSAWGKTFRAAMKTQYKAFREKLAVEKRLGRRGRTAPAAEAKEVKEFGELMFWSGRKGKFLGKIRFLLGSAWDKVLGVFERMKAKMSGIHAKVKGVSETGFLATGWRKTLIAIIVRAAKVAVGRFVTESFNVFLDCFHFAMDKVMMKLQGEISDKLSEQLCSARKQFESSKERLESEWGLSMAKLEEMVTLIQDAKYWVDIATGLISLIRAGVQIISCLTPPALGCLWGLVAQIGISAALDLIVGTQWFNENIVTPTVRDLVRKYGAPYYQQLINRALGPDLKDYHCRIADPAFPSLDFAVTGGRTGSAAIAHRNQWEAEHRDEIAAVLREHFVGSEGKPASRAEVKELLEQLKGKSPEEIRTLLEKSKTGDKVSVNLASALAPFQTAAKTALERPIPGKEPPPKPPPGPPKPLDPLAGAPPPQPQQGGSAAAGAKTPATEKAQGGGTAAEGTEAPGGEPVLRAGDLKASWDRKAPNDFRYLIVQGMTPKSTYTAGQVVTVVIDMYSPARPEEPVTVHDVKVVYYRRRTVKNGEGRLVTEFELHYEKDWEITATGARVRGGPDTKHWYQFDVGD